MALIYNKTMYMSRSINQVMYCSCSTISSAYFSSYGKDPNFVFKIRFYWDCWILAFHLTFNNWLEWNIFAVMKVSPHAVPEAHDCSQFFFNYLYHLLPECRWTSAPSGSSLIEFIIISGVTAASIKWKFDMFNNNDSTYPMMFREYFIVPTLHGGWVVL